MLRYSQSLRGQPHPVSASSGNNNHHKLNETSIVDVVNLIAK